MNIVTEKFIIQEDGLVKVDNKKLISFSEFEKIILEDIPAEKVEGFEVRYDHYCITYYLSLIHISEPTRRTPISYAVFCLKKKKNIIIDIYHCCMEKLRNVVNRYIQM